MTDFAHAGTLVHGTHRPQDLIPALVGKLTELDAERAGRITAQYPVTLADLEADHFDAANALIEDLTDALDELAPEGWYFGNHPDDGADLGFWRSDDCTCGAQGLPRDQHQGDCPVYSIGTIGRWSNDA